MKTRLDTFNNAHYKPGASLPVQLLWYAVNSVFFRSGLPFSGLRAWLLRAFGAKVGKGNVFKPRLNIKYPWRLELGDHNWIGEGVWIDNLDTVRIGSHVCISQGAYIFCGNHDYKKPAFDLITRTVLLEDGAWVGAKAVVCPGVSCGNHSVLSAGSVATKNLDAYTVYAGNPAAPVRVRKMDGGPV
jgi:putative colanic acid biosynthesis acetyltransferase WcaF